MSTDDPVGRLLEKGRGLSTDAFARMLQKDLPNEKDLISIKDLAAELGVSVRTLRRWNNHADAPQRFRRGRRRMYRRTDVQHWLSRPGADGQEL